MPLVTLYCQRKCLFTPVVHISYPALAGARRACRAGEKIYLRVYTRDTFFFRNFVGLKS